MSERQNDTQVVERLNSFKQEWFKKYSHNLEILNDFQPVIETFVAHLTPEIHPKTDLKKFVFIISPDPNSAGFYEHATERIQGRGAFVSDTPDKLQPLGLENVGVFVDEVNHEEATFGFVVFHEFGHYLIREEASRTNLQLNSNYQYLEEGFVSWLAIGALKNIGHDRGKPALPFEAPMDAPQVVFSTFLDRLAKTAVQHGKTPRYKTYKKVIEKAILPLMFSRDIKYLQRLTDKAFDSESKERFFELIKTASEQYESNSDDLNKTALDLYNFLSENNFETWEPWNEAHANRPLYRALYWPPYTTMFE